jgi:STAM-binding protein
VKTSQKTPAAVAQPSPVTEFKPSPQQKKAEIMPSYNFSTTAKLENGTELRTIFVPATLRSAFLQLAASNTQRNLETCGILSGRLKANAYFVTHLIIPAQESTSDTCHTTDETLLFNYQDKHDLFTLGWIHTHPTQTCFMSSVDVHTHMSYQVMLPEAVAIVLSPSKQPSWGAFRLTDPPGMQCIRACRQTGLFHPHDETRMSIFLTKNFADTRYLHRRIA